MTHTNDNTYIEALAKQRLNAIPSLIRTLITYTMQLERSTHLKALIAFGLFKLFLVDYLSFFLFFCPGNNRYFLLIRATPQPRF
jgi:hypothetical protein